MGDPGNFLQMAFVLLAGASSSWTERSGPSWSIEPISCR
jgi:hypothetical protein